MADALPPKVDMPLLQSTTEKLLKASEDDFRSAIGRVQDVIDDIGWYQMRNNTLIAEIGIVTFENYDSVVELITDLKFEALPQQDLLENDIQKSKQHVFESASLDAAEAAVIKLTTAGGDQEHVKMLSGVFIENEVRESLRAGQEKSDNRDNNDAHTMVDMYPSSDHQAQHTYLDEQFAFKRADRDRNVFQVLFALAQDNVQWAFQNGISIELMHEKFTARYNGLYMDLTSANIAAYRAETKANITDFEAQLTEIDAKMTIEALQFDVESKEWALKIEQANSRMAAYLTEYKGKLSRNLKMVNTRMIGGKNVADGYKSIFSMWSGRFSGVSLSNSQETE
jgi:hypothetical protein